jgi:hypothetical protein
MSAIQVIQTSSHTTASPNKSMTPGDRKFHAAYRKMMAKQSVDFSFKGDDNGSATYSRVDNMATGTTTITTRLTDNVIRSLTFRLSSAEKAIDLMDTMIDDGADSESILKKLHKYLVVEDQEPTTEKVAGAKRARGDDNPKRTRALEIMAAGEAAGKARDVILAEVQKELDITYANAYYYWGRVYKVAK